jgi:hypothetical protein
MKYRWIYYSGNGLAIAQGFDVSSKRAARKQFDRLVQKIKNDKGHPCFIVFDSENFPELF